MLMTSNFVFLSSKSRDYQGKKYIDVNIESDDEVYTLGAEETAIVGLDKYTRYCGIFRFSVFNGKNGAYSRLTLVGVKPSGDKAVSK